MASNVTDWLVQVRLIGGLQYGLQRASWCLVRASQCQVSAVLTKLLLLVVLPGWQLLIKTPAQCTDPAF
jgi:hypothetical protein